MPIYESLEIDDESGKKCGFGTIPTHHGLREGPNGIGRWIKVDPAEPVEALCWGERDELPAGWFEEEDPVAG